MAKTPHAAIKKPDASGKSINVLEVRVLADKVDYAVNGTVVGSSPKAGLTTDGIWGIRVNHLLNVAIRRHRRDAVVRLVIRRPFQHAHLAARRPEHWLKPRCSMSVGSR